MKNFNPKRSVLLHTKTFFDRNGNSYSSSILKVDGEVFLVLPYRYGCDQIIRQSLGKQLFDDDAGYLYHHMGNLKRDLMEDFGNFPSDRSIDFYEIVEKNCTRKEVKKWGERIID